MARTVKRHAQFIAMTIAAFVLLFALAARGSEPIWYDAAADALPDANSSTMRGRSTDTEGVSVSADPLPVTKEVVSSVSLVTPLRVPDCPNGSCRVAVKSNSDKSNIAVDFDDRPRPFRSRLITRRFRRR